MKPLSGLVRVLLLFSPLLACATLKAAPDEGVIGAKRSKVYHSYPKDCSSAKRIGAGNRVRFSSAEEAEKAGRRLCKQCAKLQLKSQRSREKTDGEGRDTDARKRRGDGPDHPPSPADDMRPAAAFPEFVRVTETLVGGTLVLDNGEKATLLGVVCPGRKQPHAKDAVRFITEQTRGRTVRIAYDASPCLVRRHDELGRLLVYVTPESNGRDLGGELIFQGYAWLDREVNFGRRAEYGRHEEEAWRSGRGIWKKTEDSVEEEVVTGRHARHYHRPKCPHTPHMSGHVKMTLSEAKSRRLVPCSEYRRK